MSYMPPTDAMFLWAESREHPMHVGGLQLFIPPGECVLGFLESPCIGDLDHEPGQRLGFELESPRHVSDD